MFYNYNGTLFPKQSACINIDNVAFRSGMGLIETMLFENGAIRYWNNHFLRLNNSSLVLGIPLQGFKKSELYQIAMDLISVNKIKDTATLRLMVFPNEQENATEFLMECNLPYRISGNESQNRTIGIVQGILKCFDRLSAFKTSSRLNYKMALQQSQNLGWYDALLLNQYGRIAESTISNIFWFENEKVFTPPLSEGCIAGIMRQQLLKRNLSNIPILEKPLTIERLRIADEVFLTNALRGIQPISQFEQHHYAKSKTLKLIASLRHSSR